MLLIFFSFLFERKISFFLNNSSSFLQITRSITLARCDLILETPPSHTYISKKTVLICTKEKKKVRFKKNKKSQKKNSGTEVL